jgi:Fe-S cluster assembly protein SufD
LGFGAVGRGGRVTTSVLSGSSVDSYTAAFDELSADEAPARLQSIRRAAFERFTSLGFPTTKNEDWHYTSVAPIAERDFTLVDGKGDAPTREQVARFGFGARDWTTLTFLNGRYVPSLSDVAGLPAGVLIKDLVSSWTSSPDVVQRVGQIAGHDGDAFTALNAALMSDGAVIEIPKGVHLSHPIHLLFLAGAGAAGGMMHSRNLIVAGRNSSATIIESYASLDDVEYFTNAVTEASLGDGATIRHYRIQRESRRAFHVGTVEATQAKDSHFLSFSLATGASLSRTNIYTKLDGAGSGTTLNGLYMLDGEQHCDHQTRVIHAQPNTFSRELYKGVLDGRSHGVFNGKVYVHPVAQKTDGKQTNNTLLLSETAHIDTKPQLEIFADDVKCTHGATIGQIDRTALFYLRSRGIPSAFARRLLTYAFAADVLETLEVREIRDGLEEMTLQRFV